MNLVRLVLLLITFQFFSGTITPENSGDISAKQSFHIQQAKSFSLSLIYEESKKEKEGEDKDERLYRTIELVDLSFISQVLTQIHTETVVPEPIENRYAPHPPLFALHSVYII